MQHLFLETKKLLLFQAIFSFQSQRWSVSWKDLSCPLVKHVFSWKMQIIITYTLKEVTCLWMNDASWRIIVYVACQSSGFHIHDALFLWKCSIPLKRQHSWERKKYIFYINAFWRCKTPCRTCISCSWGIQLLLLQTRQYSFDRSSKSDRKCTTFCNDRVQCSIPCKKPGSGKHVICFGKVWFEMCDVV